MEGLQRSAITFRRQGSSGIVWNDKLTTGELNTDKPAEITAAEHQKRHDQKSELRKTKSDSGGTRRGCRVVNVEKTKDPPSPRIPGCGFGFCRVFGRPAAVKTDKRKSVKNKH